MQQLQTLPQFKLRLSPQVLDWLKESSKRNHRTVNAEINFILEGYKTAKESKDVSATM